MGFENTLGFNAQAAADALQQAYAETIDDLCRVVLATARANLKGEFPEVEATLHASLTNMAQLGLIDGKIGSDHWASLLAEWGSGSEMDMSNPQLAEYRSSELWNPSRGSDGAIRGRPAGPYVGLDGEMHDKQTGKLEGVNLEELSKHDPHFQAWMESVGLPENAFQPKRPLHFMRVALLANQTLIIDQLNGVIEKFSFGAFFT